MPFAEKVRQDIDQMVDEIDKNDESHNHECSFTWALRISKKMGGNAWVCLGFVERDEEDRLFNSAMAVNYGLRKIHVVRKVILFSVDRIWATDQ